MEFLLYFIFLLNLLNCITEIIPIWNISKSAINLLSDTSSYSYYIADRSFLWNEREVKKNYFKK